MMSNTSSPMLGRASPFRALSIDRDDFSFERDKVIGELTSRMKRVAPRDNKHRRGGDTVDSDDYSPVFSPSPNYPSPAPGFGATSSDENLNTSAKASPVSEVTTSATLNPQRTASASINLAPSPKLPQRNPRSHSRDPHAIPSRAQSASRGNNMATRRTQATLQMNGRNSHGGSASSVRSNASSVRSAPPMGGRPTSTQRSISVQATSTKARTANGAAGPAGARRPLTNGTAGARSGARLAAPSGINRSFSADPDLNDPAIQAKIGNRATKVVQKSIGKCGTCCKPITEDGCTAFGKVYHKACFKCFVCKQKITGKFFEKDGKPYCQKDYQKAVDDCTVCGQPIKGDSVVSNNKAFHPECMNCYVCGCRLRGQFFTFQDKPICEQDYKKTAEKCSQCGETPSGNYYAVNDSLFCEDCHADNRETCPRCNEDVSGKVVKITGASYHPDCFSCVVCKKNMINVPFISDDKQQIYCTEDYNKKKAPRCSFCKKAIVPKEGQKTAPRLRALNRDFHPQCFQCEDCGLVLDARVKGRECYPFKNHVYCYRCNRKKLSSSESESDGDEE